MYFSHSKIKTIRFDNICGIITKNHLQCPIDGFWYTESVEVWVFDTKGGSKALPVVQGEDETLRQAALRVGKEAKAVAEDICNKILSSHYKTGDSVTIIPE
jgi:hypothetical protein